MDKMQVSQFNNICRRVRYLIMEEIGRLGVGHLGGSMSVVEALVVLYEKQMNIDPAHPKMEGRDRLVLSKGHAGPALYAVLANKGFFDIQWLETLNQPKTLLPSHADMNRTPGVDMTAGSLGQGFSCAVGIAIGSQLKKDRATIYTIIGDGETDEGIIWEAAMYAAHKKLNRLIAFTDYNKMQLDGEISEVNGLSPLADKWRSFGWDVYEVDGHDVAAIDAAVELAKCSTEKPSMILLHTLKGKGVSFLEKKWKNNHNVAISKEELAIALDELKEV
ncbi:transketolase [Christensenella timonensis]|uniref:transketolase n=1 Tax=Christensenella timonensis TaxID=1816678 RepID=UPI000830B496|nr:transketolase [Christensenella timonensis]